MPLDTKTLWLCMLVIGLGTFLIRFSFIWLLGNGNISPGLQRVLRFVPPSVLSALILPSIVFPQHTAFSLDNPRLLAGGIAAVVAWRTKSVILTIIAGMAALWLVSLI